MPPCSAAHIVESCHEIGFQSVTWQEIGAWSSLVGVSLNRWESNAIYRTIKTYLSAIHEYDGKDVPSPAIVEVDKDAVADQVRAAMRG
jgi:hypothetical protein